ncbi:MAG: M48 family metallopeptidase [Bacilli bacterium]|nr:M48 family metallopeptidase [Bacilli bacterium]MBQ6282340.1 M48 family metallopeptidase [Bacilli bacterium]
MYLDVNGNRYEIVIVRKDNRNTYIRVKEDLKVYVTTNKRVSNKYIEKLIDDNYSNIVSMINRALRKKERNDKCMILGNEVDVVSFSLQSKPELYNNKFYVKDINKLDKYIKDYAFVIFEERLKIMYDKFVEKIPYPKLKIRKMTTRWGVNNRRDNSITLNIELIRMDIKYLDYVIVHELSHFIHFDHSKAFWELVSKYCPNCKQIRKEMRE